MPDMYSISCLSEGLPVLLKAVQGGGGKGMRIVAGEEDLADAIEGARREALAAFGDGRLLVERYLARARHIEVQVTSLSRAHCAPMRHSASVASTYIRMFGLYISADSSGRFHSPYPHVCPLHTGPFFWSRQPILLVDSTTRSSAIRTEGRSTSSSETALCSGAIRRCLRRRPPPASAVSCGRASATPLCVRRGLLTTREQVRLMPPIFTRCYTSHFSYRLTKRTVRTHHLFFV